MCSAPAWRPGHSGRRGGRPTWGWRRRGRRRPAWGGGGSGGGGGEHGGGGGGGQAGPRTHPPVVQGGHNGSYSGGYYRPYYGGYYRPYYGYPYYSPFYASFGFGFGYGYGFYNGFYAPYYGYAGYGWGPYGYGYGPYPYPYYGYSGNWASARLEVKPRDAQVYVDGFLVGSVDQFDGVFQRLDLPTGEHEIVAYAKGYHSYRQRTLFRPGESYHFKGILEALPPGRRKSHTAAAPKASDPNQGPPRSA